MSKVRVTPAMILGMLAEGKDRKQIGEELGLSGVDIKRMFQHPELKGRKVKKVVEPGFVWAEEEEVVEEEVVEATEEKPGIDAILEASETEEEPTLPEPAAHWSQEA